MEDRCPACWATGTQAEGGHVSGCYFHVLDLRNKLYCVLEVNYASNMAPVVTSANVRHLLNTEETGC